MYQVAIIMTILLATATVDAGTYKCTDPATRVVTYSQIQCHSPDNDRIGFHMPRTAKENATHAVNEFDIQVCEAYAEEVGKIKCYRELRIDPNCDNLGRDAQLPCFRQAAGAIQTEIFEKKQREKERLAKEEERDARERAEKLKEESRRQASSYQKPPPESDSIPMSFQDCLSRKTQVIASLGVNPRDIIPIVNTGIKTMDRICTFDGSVLITCSKPDRKMVITKSSAKHDVGCR